MLEPFQAPCGHLILQFLFSLSLTPTDTATSGSYSVKQLHLIIFGKCSGARAVHTEQSLRQVDKDSPGNGAFQGLARQVN